MARTRVELHPASSFLPPKWRVMLDNVQHSVHDTEAEANAEEVRLRRLVDKENWSG